VALSDPEFWPVDREMSAAETIFRLTSNEDGESKGSVFVGKLDLSKTTDNRAALQDLTLLGHYMDYMEACRTSTPAMRPSFGSFPRFFGQKPERMRFRQELSSGALSHAFNRIERQFLVTLFHRSYGNNHSNLGMVEMGAGRLRVDVPIKRETDRPTPSGLAYGRIGQIVLRLQELGDKTGGGKGFQAYLDQVLATVAAVSETERRLAEISDPRSFLQKQAALSAARELADPLADPRPTVLIGKVIKPPKTKVKRGQRMSLGLRRFPKK
jgi:hypothetical protein